ncbi:MAG: PD-(D/E)XK nuclease family protein, partial [Anaerolineae bacterium]
VASHDEALDASAIRRTCDVVVRWLAAASADAPQAGGPARAIQRQVELLATLLDLSGQSALDAAQLDRYVAAATEAALRLARAPAPFPAAAGLAVVGDPGGVVGPARRVVWWNFTRDSEPPLGRRPLAPKDEAALADLGAAMPDFGVRALARAARYRRPLAMATEALLLVCPATNAAGAASHPHPLWDEVSSCLGEAEEARLTVPRPVVPVPRPGGPSQPELMAAPPRPPPVSWRRLEAPPGPRGVWQARGAIAVDRIESPSSLGTLVGCPFRWTALYVGGIRAGLAGEPPQDSAILGSLGHKIIGQVLALRPGSPAQAGEAAATVFDTEGPRMNATLFLPGRDAARSEARRLVTSGAAAITKVLQDAGLHVEAVEINLAAEADIGPVRGRADLVLGPRRAVIDLKLSGLNHRRKEIRDGTAFQLATYGRLLARDGEFPPVGYYILRQQALLSTAPGPFGEITPINGPGPEATWRGLVAAVEARRTALSAGVVAAPGSEDEVPDDVEKASLEGGRLSLPPQCHFCDLSPLCGRAFGRAAKRESTSWSGTRSTRRSHPRSRR